MQETDLWVSPPLLVMPFPVLSPHFQSLFRQLQHVTMTTRYYKSPRHTQEFLFPCHLSSAVLVHSFSPSILFQGTPQPVPVLSKQTEVLPLPCLPPADRQLYRHLKERTESFMTLIPENMSDPNQTRIAIREKSIQFCTGEHSLYTELTEKEKK